MMGKAKKAVLLIAAAVWAAGTLSGCAGGDYQPIEIPTETAGGEDIPNRVPQAETSKKETAVCFAAVRILIAYLKKSWE